MNDPEQTCEQCDGDLSEVAFCVPCWNKLGGEIIAKGESVNTLTQKLDSMTKLKERYEGMYSEVADTCVSTMKDLNHGEGYEPASFDPQRIEDCLRRVTKERDVALLQVDALWAVLKNIAEAVDGGYNLSGVYQYMARKALEGTENRVGVVIEMGEDSKPRCAKCKEQDYPLEGHLCKDVEKR